MNKHADDSAAILLQVKRAGKSEECFQQTQTYSSALPNRIQSIAPHLCLYAYTLHASPSLCYVDCALSVPVPVCICACLCLCLSVPVPVSVCVCVPYNFGSFLTSPLSPCLPPLVARTRTFPSHFIHYHYSFLCPF
jgi:hypothetical protein